MSGFLRRALRKWTPYGVVQWRRERLYAASLRRYGIEGNAADIASSAEASRFDLWPEHLRERPAAWTLVDVGANEGDFLRAVHLLVAPQKVIAVEPLADCQAVLRRRAGEYANRQVFQVILDDSPGTREILRTGNSVFSSVLQPVGDLSKSYGPTDSQVVERISVRSETLDNLMKDSPGEIGLLKIDVQGFEANVLRGAQATLRRTRAVLAEINYVQHYERATGYRELFDMLHAAGFELHGISCPYRGPAGPLWADAMFARNPG